MNNMNKKVGIIVTIVVVVGGILYFTSKTPDTYKSTGSNANTQNKNYVTKSRVVFSVTDAAVDMKTISEINVKISNVRIHGAEGWTTVSSAPKTYSLLTLNAKNESKLLADIKMDTGTYDQIRMTIDSISVKTKAGATEEAKLPSNELKISTFLLVKELSASSLNFDFLADKSLHQTGNGKYIFAPVIKTQTVSGANVKVNADSSVDFSGGHMDYLNSIGMDVDGSIKLDFQVDANAKLNIDSNNVIKVESYLH